MDLSDLETFLASYIETALWSTNDYSTPEGGEPLDCNHSDDDIAPETLERMRADCARFITENAADVADLDAVQVAHDFWLTRCGHGAGFWDGDYEEALGERLTKACKGFGNVDLYIGDDGLIYA